MKMIYYSDLLVSSIATSWQQQLNLFFLFSTVNVRTVRTIVVSAIEPKLLMNMLQDTFTGGPAKEESIINLTLNMNDGNSTGTT